MKALAAIAATLLLAGSAQAATLEEATENVRQQNEYLQSYTASQPQPAEYTAALATMDYVAGHISPARFEYQRLHGLRLPLGGTARAIADVSLELESGLCQGMAVTFQHIMLGLGYRARTVGIYYTSPGGYVATHVGAEVFYAGKWRYFDPTWQAFYRRSVVTPSDLLSFAEVLAQKAPGKALVQNRSQARFAVQSHLRNGWLTSAALLTQARAATSLRYELIENDTVTSALVLR